MKKTILAIAAAVMMSSSMLAQENKSDDKQAMKMDRTEMVKKRTEETAKRYGLDEEQTAKLLDLNTRYAEQMGPRGPRHGMHRGQRPDSMKLERRQMPKDMAKEAPKKHDRRLGMRGGHEEMRKNMEAYETELKTILTEEQYKAYQADREKRMKEGPRGRRPEQTEK